MGGSKRERKKLARRSNNAGKYVGTRSGPEVRKSVAAGTYSAPPPSAQCVQWTAREIDQDPGGESWRRWDLSPSQLVELLKFFDELRSKTWAECEAETAGGHRRHHSHDVSSLSRAAQDRLEDIYGGAEQVFRFRLSGKCRLWGLRTENLFRVLWYDPEHEVYPVSKRHT